MNAGEKLYLDRIKNLIERKLDCKDPAEWKHRDYEYLSKLIYEKTKLLISVSTLKRIWRTDYNITPQPATLDALAQFMDFSNWAEYKISAKGDVADKDIKSDSPKNRFIKKYKLLLLVKMFVILPVLIFVIFFHSPVTVGNYENVTFTSKTVITSGLPNTVIFNYDISNAEFDSAQIQQSWDKRRKVNISKDKNFLTSVYYYPGFHKAKLILDNKIVKQHNVHVKTDGWLTLVSDKNSDLIPFYIPGEDVDKNEGLHLSKDVFGKNNVNVDLNHYLVSYYNVRDYDGLDGDNFNLSVEVKNNLIEGGLTGQYFTLTILCENGRTKIPLSQKGCIGNIDAKFQEKSVYGRENDLSAFGCDMDQWNKLELEILNQNAVVKLNGNVIHENKYIRKAGKIIGLHFRFFGCGALKNIKLSDTDKNIVFENLQ